jgi:ubiquinone/menaquinone biosynthesis C-methylase UbiE
MPVTILLVVMQLSLLTHVCAQGKKTLRELMSTEKIYNATLSQILNHIEERGNEKEYLDIGSGSGDLVKLLKKHINIKSSCCDYTDTLMKLSGQHVDIVDLNTNKHLPYQDSRFDIVTATEVIEHLEDFRAILREIYRVLKPGGICVLSTPNILNLNSRLRNLWFGFAELMGPLPISSRKIESCSGHINPISIFYVVHALLEIKFKQVDFTVDKYQSSGIGKAILYWLPIKLIGSRIWCREVKKYKTIDDSNKKIVSYINSLPILLGRTIVVSAIK